MLSLEKYYMHDFFVQFKELKHCKIPGNMAKVSAENIAVVVFYVLLIYILYNSWTILINEPTAFQVRNSLYKVYQENFR